MQAYVGCDVHTPCGNYFDATIVSIYNKNSVAEITTMTTAMHAHQSVRPASSGLSGGAVRTLVGRKLARTTPVLSAETRRTFEFISDPANAHLFSKEAARKAFAHVKV